MPVYKIVAFTFFQSFSLDTQRSNDQRRVVSVTLVGGKVLEPVAFKLPAHATSADVDGFIETLRTELSPNPLSRAFNIVDSLRILASTMQSKVQTTAQTSSMAEVQQRLNSGVNSLQTARRAIAEEPIHSDTALEAGMVARKAAISEAAQEVKLAANTMEQILGELRDNSVICEEQFSLDVRKISLHAFKLRIINHGFKAEWFI